MLPFSFETTKQKLNTCHLNLNSVDLFPLAMYLLHLEIFSLVLCEVALGAQQRRPRSNGARQDSRAKRLERTRARGTPGVEGLEPARLVHNTIREVESWLAGRAGRVRISSWFNFVKFRISNFEFRY